MSRWSVWQIARDGAPERVGSYPSGADARRVLRASITRGAVVDPEGEVSEARGVDPRDVAAIEAAADAWLARGRPSADLEHLRVQLADATARAVAAEEALAEATSRAVTAERRASLDSEQAIVDAALDAEAERAARAAATAERDALDEELAVALSRLGERDRTIAALRADLRARDRTIACLRAELAGIEAHPVVRITAPRVRRVVRTETPVETLHRRLAEIAEGRR